MKRPSRGERLSVATTRYCGCLVLPTRVRRSFTAIRIQGSLHNTNDERLSIEVREATGQTGHARHAGEPAALLFLLASSTESHAAHLLHHLLHFAELFDQTIDIADGRAAAVGDPRAPTSVDQLGFTSLELGHRADDRLDRLQLVVADLSTLQLFWHARH